MCKELDKELGKGDKAMRALATHLYNMGAASTSGDTNIFETGDTFRISIERVPEDESKKCAQRPCIHCGVGVVVDNYEAERQAAEYCNQYGIEGGTKKYADIVNAFVVGYKHRHLAKKLSAGEILQHIYDSEIHLSIGWMWDGGIDYRIGADLSYIEKDPTSTDTDKIDEAIIIIADEAAKEYPKSEFTKWWKINHPTP